MDFKIGSKIWFMGFGHETEVISIDVDNDSWIGLDYDGQHLYPLNEVSKYWKDSYKNTDKD